MKEQVERHDQMVQAGWKFEGFDGEKKVYSMGASGGKYNPGFLERFTETPPNFRVYASENWWVDSKS